MSCFFQSEASSGPSDPEKAVSLDGFSKVQCIHVEYLVSSLSLIIISLVRM